MSTDRTPPTFPPRGLTYFWFLNNDCALEPLRAQMRAFADAKVAAVVLHPREGLLVPYGGRDWFELVKILADELIALGIQPWLYDEDYCPSGQAGGLILPEHPEYASREITRHEAPPELKTGELFLFPLGRLLWAGLVSADPEAPTIDLTERVGAMRRHWEVSDWDSRYYYPAMPLYDCPRSGAHLVELALSVPPLKPGQKLVAFVTQALGVEGTYGGLVDSLNPAATALFLDKVYERYARTLGPVLGTKVPAIFTDEPKFHSPWHYTPDLFESFRSQHGYDLRDRLEDLFRKTSEPRVMLTRLHYRQWLGRRFEEAWLKPVAQWCKTHGVNLVGHISPEDDLVQQAQYIANLFPLQKHFALSGMDLIVPAVGDAENALINTGVVCAASSSQQYNQPGVMSEILGASGLKVTTQQAGKIAAWQTMFGVSNLVMHAAFVTTMGLRLYDAPPDWGPGGPRWKGSQDIDAGLRPFMDMVREATQVAPVAILWPIRSFLADPATPFTEDSPRRNAFVALLLACLEAQVGVHVLDEDQLVEGVIEGAALRVGRARYGTVLLPAMSVIGSAAVERLRLLRQAGVGVHQFDEAPAWAQHDTALKPVENPPWQPGRAGDKRAWCAANLPRLIEVDPATHRHLRATRWTSGGVTTTLLMNLGDKPMTLTDPALRLEGGELVALRAESTGRLAVAARFASASVRPMDPPPATVRCTDWKYRFADEPFQPIKAPVAAYQLRRVMGPGVKVVPMGLTCGGTVGGAPLARHMDYEASLNVRNGHGATLVLEPTAARGRLTVSLGSRQWDVTVRDTDARLTRIDLSPALTGGAATLRVRVHDPMPFDGLYVEPTILLTSV